MNDFLFLSLFMIINESMYYLFSFAFFIIRESIVLLNMNVCLFVFFPYVVKIIVLFFFNIGFYIYIY